MMEREMGGRIGQLAVRTRIGGQVPALVLILIVLMTGLMTRTSYAGDGILEINHVCATQTGCFSGDSAGYPVGIDGSAGRSYRLTGDLILPDENASGIAIAANDVAVDLNGFSILRMGCEGATTNCTPASGIGIGIVSTALGTSVKNGSVTGMGTYGVFLGDQSEIVDVRARWNRFYGISGGEGSTVVGNATWENGSDGVFADDGSTVSENTSFGNGGEGINAAQGCTVSNNTAFANARNGILSASGSLVRNNTVRSNTLSGLALGTQTAYRDNVISSNSGGTVSGGVNLLGNSCDGTTTCP